MKYKIVELNNGRFKVEEKRYWCSSWYRNYHNFVSVEEAKAYISAEIISEENRTNDIVGRNIKSIVEIIKG
jgi:hypothetical protein